MRPSSCRARHIPKEAQFGDCFAACIRSLIEDESFPHVLYDNCDADTQRDRTDVWLRDKRLAFVELPIKTDSIIDALKFGKQITRFNEIHWMLSGVTVKGNGHYVVCHRDRIAHNPTEGSEITGPFGTGVFWMGLVCLRS